MNELHSDRTFSDAGSDALHRAMPHVSNCKDTGYIRLQQERIAIKRPAFGTLAISYQVWTSQDEPTIVPLDQPCEPVSPRERADENEHRTRRHPLSFGGI